MPKRNVAVICGGFTAEQNISLLSGDVVFKHINREKYQPYKVVISEQGWMVDSEASQVDLGDFSFISNGNKIKFDCVFNAIHGSPGEDGKIQGYLDMMHIPYTNCGVASSAITFNKFWTKEVVEDIVPTAKGILIKKNKSEIGDAIVFIKLSYQLPVFVKPNNNGSSYGISKIKDFEDLENAILEALKFDDEVLVEEGIAGTEVTCGLYAYDGKIEVLPVCEIAVHKHEFFDYTAKYTTGESDEIIPARITDAEKKLIEIYSEKIYHRLNCKGVVRIDYIIRNGQPFMLEVNTVPGLSENSIVPKMARAAGYTLTQFFDRLIESTCN